MDYNILSLLESLQKADEYLIFIQDVVEQSKEIISNIREELNFWDYSDLPPMGFNYVEESGAFIVEWSYNRRRIGISVEKDSNDSGWFFVTLYKKESCEHGNLDSLDLHSLFRKFLGKKRELYKNSI